MTIKKISLDPEKKLLIGLITSDKICKEIIPLVKTKYFKSTDSKEIFKWIKDYYNEFKNAPGKNIQNIYYQKKEFIQDADSDGIYMFLSSLSKNYEESIPNNEDYEIKNISHYLKTRSIEVLKDELENSLDEGSPQKAEQIISSYKRVEKSLGEGVNLLRDTSKVIEAFNEDEEVLFSFPGAFGKVAGKFSRGDFVLFLAPMKRGKTWFLWYTAETGLYHHLKIVFFSFEMTEKQMVRRSWRSLLGQPHKTSIVKIPYFEKNDDDLYEVKFKEEEREGLKINSIGESQKKLQRLFRKGEVRIISIPSNSSTVEDLNGHLDNLAYYENFIPDVIVLDYADLLLAKKYANDYRHGLNEIYANLRRMAQERNALLVSASQTEKGTFKKDINEGSAAEDIRKIAHITCGLALNRTRAEAEKGIMRIAQVVVREEEQIFDQAVLLQCLNIGRPCLESRFAKEVVKEHQEESYKRKGN